MTQLLNKTISVFLTKSLASKGFPEIPLEKTVLLSNGKRINRKQFNPYFAI